MFVVIAHFKFLPILNNDVNDICIVYTSPEKSTQLIEYYWDCIPVIGLRPESVHTRNGLGATHMQRYIDFLVWQNPTLHRNDLWRPFRSSYIRRFSRNGQIRKSQLSNILAVYKRLKTEICRNLTNSHNPKKNTGAFSPESRESIKTNELQRDSAQRFTMALRAVFSPPALYSLHPHPMGQSANLSPSRTPISSQRPTPRDHRSIEAQKNSRKNKTTAHFRAFLPR